MSQTTQPTPTPAPISAPVPVADARAAVDAVTLAAKIDGGGDEQFYLDQIRSRIDKINEEPQTDAAVSTARGTVALASGLKFLLSKAGELRSAADGKGLDAAKQFIRERMAAIQRRKEVVLGQILEQVRPLETTWRGLDLAYSNSLNAKSEDAKFFLVNVSKKTLLAEAKAAPRVNSPDLRQRQTLIESLLRDRADRFGGTPYSLVVLPFDIEADDVGFFRDLGRIGRNYRCPVVANFGPSLARRGSMPVSGDETVGELKNPKNAAWQQLTSAHTPAEAEELTYLALLMPKIGVRLPYEFERDLPRMNAEGALFRDGVIWAPATYAFAGRIDNLSGQSIHLMPAGKSYGRIKLDPTVKSENDRYATVDRNTAPAHFPVQADLYKSNADALWQKGLITVVKWENDNEVNIYGDATLLGPSPDNPVGSLGVRLTHDHILHYCNRYLYSLIGKPVDDDLASDALRTLNQFLLRNAGRAPDRPLKENGYEVTVRVNPADEAELLVSIEIDVKQSLRKVVVHMAVKKTALIELKPLKPAP